MNEATNAYIRALEHAHQKRAAAKNDRSAFLLWLALESRRARNQEADEDDE